MTQNEISSQIQSNPLGSVESQISGSRALALDPDLSKEPLRLESPTKKLSDENLDELIQRAYDKAHNRIEIDKIKKVYPYISYQTRSVFLPSELWTHDMTIVETIALLCKQAGVSMHQYVSQGLNCVIKSNFNNFWFGYQIQVVEMKHQILSRTKIDIDKGMNHAFAQLILGEAKRNNFLGALVPNQYFFGNNPGETTGKDKKAQVVEYKLKQNIVSSFEDAKVGSAVFSILQYLADEVGLTQFSVPDFNKSMNRYIRPFDELVKTCFQVIKNKNKKGKVTSVGLRAAKKPNRSKLTTKEEHELILQLIQPLWSSFEQIKNNFIDSIYSFWGWDSLRRYISQIYSIRYELLQKFGAFTSKRLIEVRKLTGNQKLKKAEVKLEDLKAAIVKRTSPVNDFIDELRAMLGKDANKVFSTYTTSIGAALSAEESQQALIILVQNLYFKDEILIETEMIKRSALTKVEKILQNYSTIREVSKSLYEKLVELGAWTSKACNIKNPDLRSTMVNKVHEYLLGENFRDSLSKFSRQYEQFKNEAFFMNQIVFQSHTFSQINDWIYRVTNRAGPFKTVMTNLGTKRTYSPDELVSILAELDSLRSVLSGGPEKIKDSK